LIQSLQAAEDEAQAAKVAAEPVKRTRITAAAKAAEDRAEKDAPF
jgi:hypothetical protein